MAQLLLLEEEEEEGGSFIHRGLLHELLCSCDRLFGSILRPYCFWYLLKMAIFLWK